MMPLNRLIPILWLILFVYWAISARGAKKNVYLGGTCDLAIVLVAAFLLLPRSAYLQLVPQNTSTDSIAVTLCAAGIAFAIWARRELGANWSARPAIKEGHELVTSGPYRLVRHPIYAGILFAMVGSVLIGGMLWLIVFLILCAVFVHRVKVEERLMMQQFPDEYPEYKKRAKSLFPFVL